MPLFLVNGARMTRCSSLILPLPIVSGLKSLEFAPTLIVMMPLVVPVVIEPAMRYLAYRYLGRCGKAI